MGYQYVIPNDPKKNTHNQHMNYQNWVSHINLTMVFLDLIIRLDHQWNPKQKHKKSPIINPRKKHQHIFIKDLSYFDQRYEWKIPWFSPWSLPWFSLVQDAYSWWIALWPVEGDGSQEWGRKNNLSKARRWEMDENWSMYRWWTY